MSSPFAAPAAPGEGITWADFNGALILIEPKEFKEQFPTSYGSTDCVRADVVILDGPNAGDTYMDTLIFPKLLVSQTKGQIGLKVLGRLGQGQAKPGQSAPWILSEATAEDQQLGERWLASQAPQTTQPAPAQGQQPAQQAPQQQGAGVPF